MDKIGGGEGYQDFLSKKFCLSVTKLSVTESFPVALISGTERIWIRAGGDVASSFSVEFFCLTVQKNSVTESFTVALFSDIEKVWIRGGGTIKFYCRKVFVSQCQKIP